MVQFPVLLITLSLAFEVHSSYAENRRLQLVRDIDGTQQLVNPNPYRVLNAHLERSFNAQSDIIFRLYTRKNPEKHQILKPNDTSSILNSNFNADLPTRFLIHGWNQNGESDILIELRRSYLSVEDFNVIGVDWGEGALTINYVMARKRVESVGLVTSQLIDTLVDASGVILDSIYVIGHSLGAHVAGIVGKHQRGQLNTIVGLDPAGPLFSLNSSDILNQNHAQYVEMVSTGARLLGTYEPLGDANFYPNGGLEQAGCGLDLFGICAHARSWIYFAETVTNGKGFRGIKCAMIEDLEGETCNLSGLPNVWMGGEPSNHERGVKGIFMVHTNSEAPFAKD
ncbi:AAEL007055-PA [Aedes aegypti]|uniref:AAEL007055-PA n=2 Tax=Aedes aegypti TaxID=7159 RepID=A0A1S4FFM1_AEDAE|nr:lipase member H [Aedes aegypti]EAT41285.1 AAEL007055-PA [Aedes aegypti]